MTNAPSPRPPADTPSGTPHPSELDIQEFGSYDVVIDARSPREFADDHIPEALNLPVVDSEQYAVVGTMYKQDRHRAYLRGVADSLRNMADAIDTQLNHLGPDARILVYCFRGGKRSRLWADALRTIGFRTDVLPGGWKRYRKWVRDGLARHAPALGYRVLGGPTGCGKTRLLQALARAGEQVLDLEGLASHRGSLIGAVPGVAQPGQKLFDSLLLATLRRFDPRRPVWVEAESKKIGSLQLPLELYESMHAAPVFYSLSLPMPERVRVWVEDFGHFVDDPASLIDRLQYLVPLVGHQTFDEWKALADSGQVLVLFERLMRDHYDPTYQRTSARHYARAQVRPIEIDDIEAATLDAVARRLAAEA
ncbi:MAG: tRNA 2-selenouridine(34) synthase MnmH [Burkholderiaceae bacterium]